MTEYPNKDDMPKERDYTDLTTPLTENEQARARKAGILAVSSASDSSLSRGVRLFMTNESLKKKLEEM